jgi:hypothetical protein
MGALDEARHDLLATGLEAVEAEELLQEAMNAESIAIWNDYPWTKKKDVLAAFDRALELASE